MERPVFRPAGEMHSTHWRMLRLALSLAVLSAASLSRPFAAQSPAGPAANSGTTLITLGTRSGPFPTGPRAQSANLVTVNGRSYLFDAGDGAARRLAETGLPIRNLDAIFLTHLHDDHTTGLVPLMSVEY